MTLNAPASGVSRIVEIAKVNENRNALLIDNDNVCSVRWGFAMPHTGLRFIGKTKQTQDSPDGEKICHA